MMTGMFKRAKGVSRETLFKTNRPSLADVQHFDVDVSLSAIREFRRNKVASKRIPSRVI